MAGMINANDNENITHHKPSIKNKDDDDMFGYAD